jgi:hypothetical protein
MARRPWEGNPPFNGLVYLEYVRARAEGQNGSIRVDR